MEYYNDYSNPFDFTLNDEDHLQLTEQKIKQSLAHIPQSHIIQPTIKQNLEHHPIKAASTNSTTIGALQSSTSQSSNISTYLPRIHITNNLLFILLIVFVAICYAQYTYINDLKDLLRLKFEIRS